jgi:hypothetical protein
LFAAVLASCEVIVDARYLADGWGRGRSWLHVIFVTGLGGTIASIVAFVTYVALGAARHQGRVRVRVWVVVRGTRRIYLIFGLAHKIVIVASLRTSEILLVKILKSNHDPAPDHIVSKIPSPGSVIRQGSANFNQPLGISSGERWSENGGKWEGRG